MFHGKNVFRFKSLLERHGMVWQAIFQPRGADGFCWTSHSGATTVEPMNQTKDQWNSILGKEAFGFSFLIILSWLVEMFHVPHLIFGEPFTPDWRRALLRTVVLLLIW
ncbi:MAG: hypothetical protein ABUL66_01145, partial [Verrucomicrobiota bacterium]